MPKEKKRNWKGLIFDRRFRPFVTSDTSIASVSRAVPSIRRFPEEKKLVLVDDPGARLSPACQLSQVYASVGSQEGEGSGRTRGVWLARAASPRFRFPALKSLPIVAWRSPSPPPAPPPSSSPPPAPSRLTNTRGEAASCLKTQNSLVLPVSFSFFLA